MTPPMPELRWCFSDLFHPETWRSLSWEAFRPGVEISSVHGRASETGAAAFLRYQPGAGIASHTHNGYEYILILEGSQQDERGLYPAGSMLVHGPGTQHEVSSPDGCVVFAVWTDSLTAQST